jgi:Pregnancy-associated plasma protein-A
MSYQCYIGGEYIETTGGDSKVFSRENIEYNSGGVITSTSGEGHCFKEPKGAPPMEINNMYVKVRLKEPYNGEFGFDWIDVSPDDKLEIQKIQDVDYSNVEYFYKEGTTTADLGNIIEKSTDERGAKNAIVSQYEFSNICKFVDMPFVLIKPNQEITLSAEIILREGEIKDDEIKITGDEFFDFEIVGGTKEGKTAKIKVSTAGKIDFKIKCLQEAPKKEYEFIHSNPTSPPLAVGGVVMMENKILKLKFRVIALVSNENDPNSKAKALFKKFKDNEIKKYLNENSLNQAGYEVEIENYNEMDNADVDDYLYAFDKADWTTKKYYTEDFNKKKKKWEYIKNPDGTYAMESDGVTYKKELKDYYEITDTITEDDQIDDKFFELYQEKLKKKTPSKTYERGVIILSEYESPTSTGAFSRMSPLNYYKLFVYSTNTESKETYAHEIGHMLGLEHLFYTTKEINSFNDSKNYYQTLKTNLVNKTRGTSTFYTFTQTRAKIATLKGALNNFIVNRRTYIAEKERNIVQGLASNGTFTYNGRSVTKTQYLLLIQEDIDKQNKYITENRNAIRFIESSGTTDFDEFKTNFNILKNDSLKIDREFIVFYEKEWEQIKSNYLRFKKTSTKNIMDYDNTRVVYLSNQIVIMRKDIKNY